MRSRRLRFDADPAARAEVAGRFLDACRTGQVAPLLEVLAPDVVLRPDGGGKASAARRPVHGAERVARFLVGVLRQAPPDLTVEVAPLNGTPGIVARRPDGGVEVAIVLDVAEGAVVAINAVRNPDKLAHLAR